MDTTSAVWGVLYELAPRRTRASASADVVGPSCLCSHDLTMARAREGVFRPDPSRKVACPLFPTPAVWSDSVETIPDTISSYLSFIFHYASESAWGRGWTARISGAVRPSQRATIGKEGPCNRTEVRTVTKAKLK